MGGHPTADTSSYQNRCKDKKRTKLSNGTNRCKAPYCVCGQPMGLSGLNTLSLPRMKRSKGLPAQISARSRRVFNPSTTRHRIRNAISPIALPHDKAVEAAIPQPTPLIPGGDNSMPVGTVRVVPPIETNSDAVSKPVAVTRISYSSSANGLARKRPSSSVVIEIARGLSDFDFAAPSDRIALRSAWSVDL